MSHTNPIGHVTDPNIVGGPIIALKCQEGIVLCTNTLLSFGGLLSTSCPIIEYQDVSRFERINDRVVVVATGEYADFQESSRRIRSLVDEAALHEDRTPYSVTELMNYLSHICYERRNDFNPYYNSTVIAGFKGEESVLASVDLFGTLIKNDYVAVGFAKHFGLAIIAN
jgi:20S proteasome subunit beta 7